jgi:PAS domain S-box-containing protein
MIQNKEIVYEILKNSLTSLEEAISLDFPLFIKNKNGDYVYISDSLLEDKNLKLYSFLQSDEEKTPPSLRWIHNDVGLFKSNKKSVDRIFKIDGKIYRVIKFLLRTEGEDYILGIALDVSETSRVLDQDYLLSRVLENLSYSVVVSENSPEKDYPIVFVNQEFVDLTGYSLEEVKGKNCRFLQGPDSSPQFKEGLKKSVKEGKSFSGVIKNYKKQGQPFWNKVNIKPIYDPETKSITHFLGMQKEVADPNIREVPITEIYDGLPCLTFELDSDFIIRDINRFALDFLDYEEDEVRGKPFADFLYGESIEAFELMKTRIKLVQSLLNERVLLQKKTGHFCRFILSAKTVEDKNYTFLLIELTDEPAERGEDFDEEHMELPDSTPWYVQIVFGLYFKLINTKSHWVRASILALLSVLPLSSFILYAEFLNPEFLDRVRVGSKEELTFLAREDLLWEIKRAINPYFYTKEKRDKIKPILRELKNDTNAQRVVMRVYEDKSQARLVFDLYSSGPKILPIAQDKWVVNLEEDAGYQNLTAGFLLDRCVARRRGSLDVSSGLYNNLLENNVSLIVSCSDNGNDYFYVSLDFNEELNEEEYEEVRQKIILAANEIEQVLVGNTSATFR